MADTDSRLRKFLDELAEDPLEEMVVEYAVREVHNGRSLADVLSDPYVRNRLDKDKIAHVLENPQVIDAVEASVKKTFADSSQDFGFSD